MSIGVALEIILEEVLLDNIVVVHMVVVVGQAKLLPVVHTEVAVAQVVIFICGSDPY